LALWLDLTGLSMHQWMGLGVVTLACYHLGAHTRWVTAVTGRLFGRTSRQARSFYAVDAGLAVGFAVILVTGVAISTWLDLTLASYASWRSIHVLASVVTLALCRGLGCIGAGSPVSLAGASSQASPCPPGWALRTLRRWLLRWTGGTS
jgi:hypothetical protein